MVACLVQHEALTKRRTEISHFDEKQARNVFPNSIAYALTHIRKQKNRHCTLYIHCTLTTSNIYATHSMYYIIMWMNAEAVVALVAHILSHTTVIPSFRQRIRNVRLPSRLEKGKRIVMDSIWRMIHAKFV